MQFLSRLAIFVWTCCWLVAIVVVHGESVRGVTPNAPIQQQEQQQQRELMPGHNMFGHLSCNDSFQACEPWSAQGYDPASGTVVIPCGKCITMDASEDLLSLPNGLNIEGKLVFPDGYKIIIETPYIVVQGELEMTSTRATSGQEDVQIIMTSLPEGEDVYFTPHGGMDSKKLGTRPVAVMGGLLNIRGLPDQCPSWVKLKDIATSQPSISSSEIPTYTPPASGCSDELVATNFEGNQGISWPSGWYRNYGGVHSYETENPATPGSTYALYGGRTSTWNGPQTNFDASCIVPGATYFISAKARLTKPGSVSNCQQFGTNCLKITSYMKDTDTGKKWNNRGNAGQHNDGEWFDFTSFTTFDDKMADATTAIARRLFWEGPEAGVEIALDDIRVFRLPESSFPAAGITPSEFCSELIPNGDAEDTSMLPFTYPASPKNGILSVESETLDGVTNHYYALKKRDVTWASPKYNLPVGCIERGTVYSFQLDIRMHSSTKESFRLEMVTIFEDGSPNSYKWLAVCPKQDINDGWVHCGANYQFPEYQSTPSKIEIYLVQNDSSDWHYDGNFLVDADFDNFSASFRSGPANSIVLSDPDGSLANCWGVGSQILVTSSNLDFDDVATPTIKQITSNANDNTVNVDLSEAIQMTSTEDSEGIYGVEVALLSRNIGFSSDSDAQDQGGHLIVFHTDRGQQLDGVSFEKFGQQGNLGRYPVHFHMSGSAAGSMVSRNLVMDSNQRCYVIHGTNDVTMDSNVCYNHFGHGFLLEDHAERNNVLQNNLVAVTKKAITKISNDESDDTPSSYWITNPENTFVGNVAAGSEDSGFWFEMSTKVRGPSANMAENAGYDPRRQPLKVFRDNIAHSNNGHGIKTYPGSGYWPYGDSAVFQDCISYRNAGNGVFIHNSGNIKIEGGIFADNRVQVDLDRSPACTVDGARIIGYSEEFRSIKETTKARGHCPSSWPLRGIEIHSYWVGGSKNGGATITNTLFENFEGTECDDTVAILVDEENRGYFDVRSKISNLNFSDPNSIPLSNCATAYSGLDNLVLNDEDGSVMGEPGYIVSDTLALTTFADCYSDYDSCTAHCPGACFRSMVLSVSTLEAEDPTVELEITDNNSNQVVYIQSSYEMPFNSDGSINIAEHTKTHRSNLFYAVLPAGGDYSARFLKNGEEFWPLYVRPDYDDQGSSCSEFASFEIIEPQFDPSTTCQELIRNGDMELGIEGWLATMGGVESIDASSSGQGLALTSIYRTAYWMGPAQYLDTRCLVLGATYAVSYKAKLISANDGSPIDCDPAADSCPKLIGKMESGAHEERDPHWKLFGRFPSDGVWVADGWNTITGGITVDETIFDADSTEAYFESKTLYAPDGSQVLMVIDDVSIQLQSWPDDYIAV